MKQVEITPSYENYIKDARLAALQNKRDTGNLVGEVMKELEAAPKLAFKCFYSLVSKAGIYTGMSVRLAEIIARHYGNLSVFTHVDKYDKSAVHVHGIAHDLESNNHMMVTATEFFDFKGFAESRSKLSAAQARAQAKARRDSIFGIIPYYLLANVEEAAIGFIEKNFKMDMEFFSPIDSKRLEPYRTYELLAIQYSCQEEGISLREFFPLTSQEESESALNRLLNLGENGDENHN